MNMFNDAFIFRLNPLEENESFIYMVDLREKYEDNKDEEFSELRIKDFVKDDTCKVIYFILTFLVIHVAYTKKRLYMANTSTFMIADIPEEVKDFGPERTYTVPENKIYTKTIDA